MSELYLRQEALKLEVPDKVAVIGCGGVGSWVAWFLALSGVKELWLFDGDKVEEHNLNRLPLAAEDVGKDKTQAVGELIQSRRHDCAIVTMGKWSPTIATQIGLNNEVGWVVCATDSLANRAEVSEWCSDNAVNYIEVSAEGEMAGVTGEPAEFATSLETEPGYASIPVWCGPAVMAAVTACYHVCHNAIPAGVVRIGWEDNQFVALSVGDDGSGGTYTESEAGPVPDSASNVSEAES
jgi:threonine dehydrogenase-like Zn-dependent dehydrogenase